MAGRKARIRVPTTEYQSSVDVIPALVAAGMSNTEATAALSRNSARLRRSLGLEEGDGPIIVDGESVKFKNLAGVIRIAPGIELDVAPKFLGHAYAGWREDLLAISNYTQRGRLSLQHVRAQAGGPGDLASVIGRTFISEFWQHQRKPLRLYRQQSWRDFSLDGELEVDELSEQSSEGLPQRAVVLDRRNAYNALLAQAADRLIADANDGAVRSQLHRVRSLIGPQSTSPARSLRPVPARHRQWEGLIELSKRIVSGADLTLQADRHEAPGFIVRTWEAWERLTFLALRNRFGAGSVTAQQEHSWGSRNGETIMVKPDVTIAQGVHSPRLLDAKYKTRLDRKGQRIAQTDLMEASAFMAACDSDRIVLLYPRSSASGPPTTCGSARVFDCVTLIPGRQVIAVEVEVRGFSARNEHRRFAELLALATDKVFSMITPAVGTQLS